MTMIVRPFLSRRLMQSLLNKSSKKSYLAISLSRSVPSSPANLAALPKYSSLIAHDFSFPLPTYSGKKIRRFFFCFMSYMMRKKTSEVTLPRALRGKAKSRNAEFQFYLSLKTRRISGNVIFDPFSREKNRVQKAINLRPFRGKDDIFPTTKIHRIQSFYFGNKLCVTDIVSENSVRATFRPCFRKVFTKLFSKV